MAFDAALMVIDATSTLVDGEQGVPRPARGLVARSMVGRSFPTVHFAAILPNVETTCRPSFLCRTAPHAVLWCSIDIYSRPDCPEHDERDRFWFEMVIMHRCRVSHDATSVSLLFEAPWKLLRRV
jgi:hypothetical protein